jgi:outer membrane immunogenic protein
MRKVLTLALVAVGCVAVATPGSAQDRPAMWAGAYAGLNLGGVATKFQRDDTSIKEYNGGLVGGRLGYNFQSSSWVYGVELDGTVQFGERKTNVDHTVGFVTPHTHTDRLSLPVMGDVRARLGYAFGPTLVYGFAGVGAAQLKRSSETKSATQTITSESSKSHGAVVFGVGAAYKFSPQFSGDLEVARYQVGETLGKVFDMNNGVFQSTSVRAGLSYHFN